jgi:hypothetical protein
MFPSPHRIVKKEGDGRDSPGHYDVSSDEDGGISLEVPVVAAVNATIVVKATEGSDTPKGRSFFVVAAIYIFPPLVLTSVFAFCSGVGRPGRRCRVDEQITVCVSCRIVVSAQPNISGCACG